MRDGAALAAAVCGPLLLYWLSLPRNVVLEDDGLFLMAGATFGIAHPPGYPLYTLIAHLFSQLPFGTPAVLGHLSSAFLGALACAAVHLCARLLGASVLAALAGAWLFAASEHFWSQAIIAEVYTLNALLFFACFALLLRSAAQPERWRWWLGAAAAYGLSLANHWPLMVLATPGLLMVSLPAATTLRHHPRLLLAMFAVAFAAAALPYLGMVVRSWQAPVASFYGAIEDWPAFWHYVSRAGYIDVNPVANWGDRLAYLRWFGGELLWQLTLPGCALALLGLVVLLRSGRLAASIGGLLALLGNSVVLLLGIEFEFDFLRVAIFRPYSLICYGLAAVYLAVGLRFAAAELAGRWPIKRAWPPALTQNALIAAAGLAMSAASVAASWPVNNRAADDFAAAYADMVFDTLPSDAVVIVHGDVETAVLGYYRHVEQRRPDVDLYNTQGLVFRNRLFSPLAAEQEKNKALQRLIAETERPVFYRVWNDPNRGHGIQHHGFLKEVLKGTPSNFLSLIASPIAADYFTALLARRPTDPWEKSKRLAMLNEFGQFLSYALLAGDANLGEHTRALRTAAEGNLASLMGMIQVLLKYGADATDTHLSQVDAWIAAATRLQNEALGGDDATMLSRWRRAELAYLTGVLRAHQGDAKAATDAFRASWRLNPASDNPARDALAVHGITVTATP